MTSHISFLWKYICFHKIFPVSSSISVTLLPGFLVTLNLYINLGTTNTLVFSLLSHEYGISSVQSLSHVRLFATPWIATPRPPCPSPTAGVYPNPCPLSRWCHPTISSSVIPFSSSPQSFPASGSFQISQLFSSGGQSIGVSASTSVLPMNTQDWSPLGWTGWISLQSKPYYV